MTKVYGIRTRNIHTGIILNANEVYTCKETAEQEKYKHKNPNNDVWVHEYTVNEAPPMYRDKNGAEIQVDDKIALKGRDGAWYISVITEFTEGKVRVRGFGNFLYEVSNTVLLEKGSNNG